MTRRKRLFPKMPDQKPSQRKKATADLKFGTKVKVVGPDESSDTKDLWYPHHQGFQGMEGYWHDVIDNRGWMVVYFPDLQTGEVFQGDWLEVIEE